VGEAGADRLADHSGRDSFSGGAGNDHIDARDTTALGRRTPDTVSCGSGRYDVVLADRRDRVNHDCERIIRR
jgi:Ca2+-binding RTX toxin-like protein